MLVERHAEVRSRTKPIIVAPALALLLAAGMMVTGVVAHASPGSLGDKAVRTIGRAATVGTLTGAPTSTITTTTTAAHTISPAGPVTTQATASPPPVRPAVSAPTANPTMPSATNPITTTTAVVPWPPRVAVTTVPTSNGTGLWRSNPGEGITITMQMQPLSPVAGQTVHFSITVTYQQGQGCCADSFNPGDGTWIQLPQHSAGPCGAPHPAAFTEQVDHMYSHPGVFAINFNAGVLATCQAPPMFINTAQLPASVVVDTP